MVRGGRGGGGYRGSTRGHSSWNGDGYRGRSSRDRFNSFNSYDKGRYASDRFSRGEEFLKSYRMDSYSSRDRHSPERKRPRIEGPRHESYGNRYSDSYSSERRGYSGERERHPGGPSPYSSRREEFRKPPPPPSPRGSNRGRISTRGSRGLRRSDRGGTLRRRMTDRSYVIKKRGLIRNEFRKPRLVRMRSSVGHHRREIEIDSDKEESDGEEIEKPKELKEKKEKVEKNDDDKDNVKETDDKEGEVTAETAEGENEQNNEKGDEDLKVKSTYVKLICPQCNIKVSTFRRYEAHLRGKTHLFAMRKVAAKQRSILAQMRQAQRNAQNELEKSGENITEHTVFCPLCKLNYKQERAVHQATPAHKNMKKFLLPVCKVCKISFKSPMVYENHLCSIDHIKMKQRSEGSEGDDDNLEEFTTIDSVGEVDENLGSAEEDKEKEAKKKDRVSVGIEQIKKIEAYYCDLCRMYLPIGTENEYPDILAQHCRKRFHMQRYIRYKENEELKKRAEKLQRKEMAEKEKKKEDVVKKEEVSNTSTDNVEEKEEVKKEGENKEDDAMKVTDEDKLWEAVDKDLGELLEETDGNKSDDDDDDSRVNGGRYDRFKSDDKEGKDGVVIEKPAEAVEKKEEDKK